ncbi:MAG TPA: phasin family protein [Albitalea sp.]|uniref:phasin family protein n=1 Tax=Piscinibacter sp. TaxID=1903157 RepID=UPI002ED1FC9C
MAGKTGTHDSKQAPRKQAAKSAPRKRLPKAPADQAEVAAAPPAEDSKGARALIRAGLKALGEVRGDMVARQTRIFELLLGIGQSPAWRPPAKAEEAADPFGKFEDVFDQRVARSLERLGMPSPQALNALSERVEALSAQLRSLETKPRRR